MKPSLSLPPTLQPGDTLHVVAPSGALREKIAFNAGVEIWRQRGYRVQLSPGYDQR
ncbi:MAG: LD-carboxypeptidase, partial [Cyanobacteria bacterium J06628_4]